MDVEGLPLRVIVHYAGLQDRDGAGLVLDKIRQRFPWLEPMWADGGYNARQVADAVAKSACLRLEIVKRSDAVKGFVVLPRRWVVERTFSWFSRNTRTSPTPSPPSSPWPQSNSLSGGWRESELLI